MRNIYQSADQLIGRTPLLELTHLESTYQLDAALLGKLKFHVSSSFLKQKIPVRKITFKYQTIVSQNTIAG